VRKSLITFAAVGVLALSATACGGDDDGATVFSNAASARQEDAGSTTTSTTAAPEGDDAADSSTGSSSSEGDTVIVDGDEATTTTTAAPRPSGDRPAYCDGEIASLRRAPADAPPECLEPAGPTAEPVLGTGDVQVTLRWESNADVDLHVTEPDGTELWYGNKGPSATGGQLDVDSNVGCEQEASVENVFWPTGGAPTGAYTVAVTGFEIDGCGSGDYTVTAKVRGEIVLDESGTVGEDETDTYQIEA
jgi:hypothetical protein